MSEISLYILNRFIRFSFKFSIASPFITTVSVKFLAERCEVLRGCIIYFIYKGIYLFGFDKTWSFLMEVEACRLRWTRGSVLAFGTQVRGLNPGRSRRKNPQHAFLRMGSKTVCPMSPICGM
jgi:hypothetical protein